MIKRICAVFLALCVIYTSVFAAGNISILEEIKSTDINLDVSDLYAYTKRGEGTNEVIVGLKNPFDEFVSNIPNVLSYKKLTDDIYLLAFENENTALVMTKYLRSDPNVKDAMLNGEIEHYDLSNPIISEGNEQIILNDTSASEYPNDYSLHDGQWYLDDINAKKGWDALAELNADASAVVAVLDCGLDINNDDIKNRIYKENNAIVTYNAVDGSSDVTDNTMKNGHGTRAASVIAAEADNGYGICGVTGKYDVSILPIKIIDSNNVIKMPYLIAGIEYAIKKKVDVINLSISTTTANPLLNEKLLQAHNAGIVVVSSAGNDYTPQYSYPASSAGVISVGATDKNREKAVFSQYNDMVDIVAPGQDISLIQNGAVTNGNNGTSFSSPIVAGAAALVKIANPSLTPRQIETILKLSANDLGKDGYDIDFGYGLVDIESAVKRANLAHIEVSNITYTTEKTLTVSEKFQIETTITPSNADNKNLKFVSSDTSVAKVTSNGVVYAVGPGVADIFIISDDNNDLSFDETGACKMYCTVTVYPILSEFSPTALSFGKDNVVNIPILEYDKFYLASTNSIYKIYNDASKVKVAPVKTIKSQYKFIEYMPKNADVNERKNVTHLLVSDKGQIVTSDTESFTKTYSTDISKYWTDNSKFVALAGDGASFTLVDNNNHLYYYNVFSSDVTKNTMHVLDIKYQFNDIKYVSHEDAYMYIAVGKNDDGKSVVGYSRYGGKAWNFATLNNHPVFNQIVVDGQICYLLADDAVYYTKAYRDSSITSELKNMLVASPLKLTDIDSSKIKKISLYSNAGKNILVGYGADNKIYKITSSGVEEFISFDEGLTVEHAFVYNGVGFAVVDGVLYTAYVKSSDALSNTEGIEICDLSILDENGKIVSSVPENGKFSVEYYMECNKEIAFTHEKYNENVSGTSILNNKYPVQIITAVYDADTKKLVSIKNKNYTIGYGSSGIIFKWVEDFNLPEGNYTVKTMTFKGNGFYWPQKDDAHKTLDVFAKALE